MKEILILQLLLILLSPFVLHDHAKAKEVMLADFEIKIPCSEKGDIVGFRKADKYKGTIVKGGTEGTKSSAEFTIQVPRKSTGVDNNLFFQGKVRRMYLATKRPEYIEGGPNALSFWIKLQPDSVFINREKREVTLGVWSYHWELGDGYVGGKSNNQLATDSMMHGYSNFGFSKSAAGKWVNIVLTPSAFQQSRYYYHFYAARGTTDELKFMPSLRQIEFKVFPEIKKEEKIQIDQLKMLYIEPVAVFKKDYYQAKVSPDAGDVTIPVVIVNPTKRDRKYRVFISSVIGVHRNVLYNAHTLTNGFYAPRTIQRVAGGDGGLGAVELINGDGISIIEKQQEIVLKAGKTWKGELVHHIKPEMLGKTKVVKANKYKFFVKRNTLTTSVIVWDPYDDSVNASGYLDVLPSNADDGKHWPPPGFPVQERPPEGWRSENIPLSQAGGYFVSVITIDKQK